MAFPFDFKNVHAIDPQGFDDSHMTDGSEEPDEAPDDSDDGLDDSQGSSQGDEDEDE